MSMESVLLKACFIRNGGVYQWQECQLTLFHIKVTGSLKSDFSASNLGLNQYSLSNHLRGRGIGAQRGNSCREKEEKGWRKSNPSSSGDQSVGVGSLEWILSEGQCSEHRELTTTAQRWWHRDGVLALREREREGWIKLKAELLKSSSLCVHFFFFLNTWLLSKKHRTWLELRRVVGPPRDRPRP